MILPAIDIKTDGRVRLRRDGRETACSSDPTGVGKWEALGAGIIPCRP